MRNNFKLGADTEFIAIKTIRGEDRPFPMEGLLVGTKSNPEYIDSSKQRGVLLDNVCIEYVCKPADTKDDFVNEQVFMKDYVDTYISTFKLKLHKETSATFMPGYLNSENNKEFGCSPAFNPRTMEAFTAPNPDTSLRTASFHLHISLNEKKMEFEDAAHMALLMDLYVGLPSVVLQHDKNRRSMYGKAGEFRHTLYGGVEYRVLGNEYLFDRSMLELVYEQTADAIEAFRKDITIDESLSDKLEDIINNYKVDDAKELINKLKLRM